MLSQIPSRTLETGEPCARSFVALCFHILTNCFSRLPAGLLAGKPFVLTTIRITPGCGRRIRELPPFFSVRSVSRRQIHSFHTIANSLSLRKKSSALESRTSGLFCKNTRGGGVSIHDKLVSRSRSPWSSQPRDVSVRVTSSRDVPVPEPLPTRGSLMLVFALQDAARAAQVLALLTSSRCRLRFECFPCGRLMSRRAFAGRGRSVPGLPHKKERPSHDRPSRFKNVHGSPGNQAGAFTRL
jgi:hypothetical protein